MTADANDKSAVLRRGLAGIALLLIVASVLAAAGGWLIAGFAPGNAPAAQRAVLVTIGLTLSATLIGFFPLWLLLAGGVENIFAAWLAAMMVRMFLCLIGLLALVKGLNLPAVACALTLIGHYIVLLAIETAAMNRLVGRLTRKSE